MTKSIELSIQIFKQFVIIQENREYIISTNKIVSIVELLLWFLKMNRNGNQYSFFGITFLPQLFEIITLCVKHRVGYQVQSMKQLYLEYILCSSLLVKLNQKFV